MQPVFLIAVYFPTWTWNAQVCRSMLPPVLIKARALTGGNTPMVYALMNVLQVKNTEHVVLLKRRPANQEDRMRHQLNKWKAVSVLMEPCCMTLVWMSA